MAAEQVHPSALRTMIADHAPPGAADLVGGLPDALARADFTNLSVLLRHARDGCWAFALYIFGRNGAAFSTSPLLLRPSPINCVSSFALTSALTTVKTSNVSFACTWAC
ncbi:MAG: hypothetical protein ACUVR4_05505 [Anaerolineae bacterium]